MNINITLCIKRSNVPTDYSAGTYDVSVKMLHARLREVLLIRARLTYSSAPSMVSDGGHIIHLPSNLMLARYIVTSFIVTFVVAIIVQVKVNNPSLIYRTVMAIEARKERRERT